MIQGEVRELRTIEEAIALLDEWITAYGELRREHMRLEERCWKAEWWANHHADMRRHLDPFLPDQMQVAEWRAADPKLYAAIAQLRVPRPRRSPFDEPVTADPFA